jgi:hypothetical protein
MSSNAAVVARCWSVQVSVDAVTARCSASRRRWSTATNVGLSGAATLSPTANAPRERKTFAVTSPRLSSVTSS